MNCGLIVFCWTAAFGGLRRYWIGMNFIPQQQQKKAINPYFLSFITNQIELKKKQWIINGITERERGKRVVEWFGGVQPITAQPTGAHWWSGSEGKAAIQQQRKQNKKEE